MSRHLLCACLMTMVFVAAEARAQTVTRAFLRADRGSPQQADPNTWISFFASAEGGREPHEFKWWLWDGTAWRVVQDWTLRTRFYWHLEQPGEYIVAVWARSHGSSVDAAQALAQLRYRITPFVFGAVPQLQIVFTRNSEPFYVNDPVMLEAWITGSYEPELKWVWWDGQRWATLRDWERGEVFIWRPPAPGAYRLAVWVRHGNVTADAPQILRELVVDVLPPGGIPRARDVGFHPDLPSPQAAGTPVTFSAQSNSGRAPHEFKWWLWNQTTWSVLADWSASPTVTWTPSRAGRYTILAWVRSQGTTRHPEEPSFEIHYTVDPAGTPQPARDATLVAQPSGSLLMGTPIRFTASASGGVAPYQFKWWLTDGTGWRPLREWSEDTTLTWTPASAGFYQVAIWARSHGVTLDARQALAQLGIRVLSGNEIAPPSAPRITTNLASPRIVGMPVTFTATAQGGVPPHQFRWWLSRNDGPWQILRDWNAASTLTWTPSEEGSYRVAIWARSNGVTENVGNVLAQINYRIDPPVPIPPVTGATLGSDVASPQRAGTPITFSATATGGLAPAEFKWWIRYGTTWVVLREWSTAATLTWTPPTGGDYMIAIWARSSGVTTDARQALAQVSYTILF